MSKDVVKMLVANKIDINVADREVQQLEGKTLADKFGIPFMEVSAKTGHNVNELFVEVGSLIVDSYLPNRQSDNDRIPLSRPSFGKKKKDCQC